LNCLEQKGQQWPDMRSFAAFVSLSFPGKRLMRNLKVGSA
jgi:hypothetical protein